LDRQRIDKWLWHARIVKTRSAAAGLVSGGRVRVNGGRITAPGHALDGRVCVWRVEQFAERRGASPSARALYTDIGTR